MKILLFFLFVLCFGCASRLDRSEHLVRMEMILERLEVAERKEEQIIFVRELFLIKKEMRPGKSERKQPLLYFVGLSKDGSILDLMSRGVRDAVNRVVVVDLNNANPTFRSVVFPVLSEELLEVIYIEQSVID